MLMLVRCTGMGNRFRSLPQYHNLILGHGIVAVITFLFVVPAAILIARFYRSPAWALKFHVYLQVLTVALSTVLFILGFMAVGPERSLTNPHHGIGVALYVLVMVQALAGGCIHKREKGKARRKIPIKLVLHQWVGRAIAMLGFAQVPLGLTLYGSPKFTFILYAVWMAFLLVLFFILNYRAMGPFMGEAYSETTHTHSRHGTVIEEKKKSRFGMLGTLAAGAGVAALLGKKRRGQSRSRSRERRDEVVGSRRDSASFIEEKYETKQSGGVMGKVFKGAAAAGGIALAKNWWDKRQARKNDDVSEYSSVAQNTPIRKHGSVRPSRHGRHGSSYHDEITTIHTMEEGRPGTASGLGGPLAAATAISAANRPVTPRPVAHRRDSYDSDSYYNSELSPSRRTQAGNGARNGVLAAIGLGWFAKKMKDRRDRRELDRLDALETERIERERLARLGGTPSRLTGDGFARPPRRTRPDSVSITNSSDLSSIIMDDRPSTIRPVGIPPVTYGGGPVSTHTETVITMPPAPPDPHGILHQETVIESGSENYMSAGGHPHRRHSSRRRREGEEAAIAATAAAASLAAAEEERRRRSRSHVDVVSPPVSVKVKVHGDKNQNVTLRRLTEQEAEAERNSRKTERRRRRADSLSSLSGTDTAASRRRYRRGERTSEATISGPPPAMAPLSPLEPLSPPNPAFAKGRKPKDSAYYSGKPGGPGGSSNAVGGPGSVGSPESHGTWSAMSPGSASDSVDPAERRRRRRMERNQRSAGGTSRVDFS